MLGNSIFCERGHGWVECTSINYMGAKSLRLLAARRHGRSRLERNSLAFSRDFDRMCMSLL
jgi:hypothetical protein